jgi:hypothetical protein
MYYVYLHLKEDTLEPFYVGKGKNMRAFKKWGRNKHWESIVDKHGYLIKILYSDLTEEEAFELEKQTIKNISELGIKLANKTEGGDGVSGYKHSDEAKAKMSEAKKGKERNYSEEYKEILRERIALATEKRLKMPKKERPSEWNLAISNSKKGKKLPQVTCPHCNKEMSRANEKLHNHIEKCANKQKVTYE